MSIQRALISVSDKTGVVDFARALAGLGVELLSTGGTSKALRDAGLAVKDVSEFTGCPEMLDGRVKTLHPKVHGGLLYMRGNAAHEATVKKHGLQPIDLVCVNLYPFESTVARPGVGFEEAIENIDIGGPSMLRSAAKNHRSVTVVTDPADYELVLAELRANGGDTTPELRRRLAQKVYARTAMYDAAIAGYLAGQLPEEAGAPMVVSHARGVRLRYGENPHQDAWFYPDGSAREASLAFADILHGKEMSYNNYVDGDAALEAVRELSGVPAAAIIKHNNACGLATGETLAAAIEAAWSGDTVSAYGSVLAVTVPVDAAAAQVLRGRFVEAMIAPDFTPEALDFLKNKSRDIRLIKLHKPVTYAVRTRLIRQINGGVLVQDKDTGAPEQWIVPTEQLFPEEKRALADFGVRVCKHIKSNAIVIVREYRPGYFMLLGMGAGQPNRVDALRKLAIVKARENIAELYKTDQYGKAPTEFELGLFREAVLVSDAFFPFPDSIQYAAEAGLRYIVQPGGSRKDEEVIAACDKYGIAMAMTGVRHFKH